MPICHDAKLFPRLFSSNRSLDVPYLPLEADLAPIGENRSFNLEGTLCFYIVHNISEASSCIPLYNQTAGWFDLPPDSGGPCHSAKATWVSGWWPAKMSNSIPPRQPKWAPYCSGVNWGEIWPWTGCQSHTVTWVDKAQRFSFSPWISTGFNKSFPGSNFSDQNPFQSYVSNPFDNWLLYGINGSCMNLEPMIVIGGGVHGVSQFTWSTSCPWGPGSPKSPQFQTVMTPEGVTAIYSAQMGCSGEGSRAVHNITYNSTPVCVYPPFLFILSKAEPTYCDNYSCFYTQC